MDWMMRWSHFRKVGVLDDLVGWQVSANDVQLEDFGQFLLIGKKGVQIGLTQATEGFVGRGQQGQFAAAGDVLHKTDGVVFHDAVELVENSVTLFLQAQDIRWECNAQAPHSSPLHQAIHLQSCQIWDSNEFDLQLGQVTQRRDLHEVAEPNLKYLIFPFNGWHLHHSMTRNLVLPNWDSNELDWVTQRRNWHKVAEPSLKYVILELEGRNSEHWMIRSDWLG